MTPAVDQSLEAAVARLRCQRTEPRPLGAQERVDLTLVLDELEQVQIGERSLSDDVEALRIENAALNEKWAAERVVSGALRTALAGVVEQSPLEFNDGYFQCVMCSGPSAIDFKHADDCPWLGARAALEELQ